MTNLSTPLTLYQPAEYLIEVQGRLDPKWSASFGGMAIIAHNAPGGFTITTLRGSVTDQSTLHGMLRHIGDLGLPLLKVECISAISPEA